MIFLTARSFPSSKMGLLQLESALQDGIIIEVGSMNVKKMRVLIMLLYWWGLQVILGL